MSVRGRAFALAAVRALSVAVALLGQAAPAAAGEDVIVERVFAAPADFDECYRDTAIDVQTAPGFVVLRDEVHLVDVHGNRGARPEPGRPATHMKFTPGLIAKRVFELDGVDARGADVFFFGRATKASLNGYPVRFDEFVHHGGWVRAEISPDLLREGRNEIVFHAGLSLFQDAEVQPAANSYVSHDGGITWEAAADGEFLVNVRLHRHPEHGVITSPAIDLANPEQKAAICPLVAVEDVSVTADVTTPKRATVLLEARCGSTPWPDDTWGPWRRARAVAPARYVQWRATLQTRDPLASPVLTRVTVRARTQVLAEGPELGPVTAFRNHKIVRSSYVYEYQRPSENLAQLRKQFDLDAVVAGGKTDWDRLVLLRNWVRRQWPKNDKGSCERTWNALEILSAPDDHHGMCVHFATAFSQCALALGYNARPVIIQNHFVADVWSDAHQTWALMDVEAVYPPRRWEGYGTAHYIHPKTRRPLNCLELHGAYHRALNAATATIEDMVQVYSFDTEDATHVPHELTRAPDWARVFTRFMYPLRNNHLDRLEPWEEYHGAWENYHSNDYLWWRSAFPAGAEPQYPLKTDREGDLYWTINQAALTLTATEQAGALTVTVDTVTPNFDAFLYQVDGGQWQRLEAPGSDPDARRASFAWNLSKPVNRLRARTVNRFGREGAVSSVVVAKAP